MVISSGKKMFGRSLTQNLGYHQDDAGTALTRHGKVSSLPRFYQCVNAGNQRFSMTVTHQKSAFEEELASLISTALNLDMASSEIDPTAPLYGDGGLGLDSIDALELSLALSKRYGVQLRADDENNSQIFASLRALAAHILHHRTK